MTNSSDFDAAAADPEAPTAEPGGNRRLSLITVDQILSSLSNIGVLVWVAHTYEPSDFGRFSLIMMVYIVAQVAVRSLISTTVVVHPEEADERPRTILASAVVVGLGAGVLSAAAGALLLLGDSPLAWPVLALAAPMPLLVVHDVGRYLGIARRQPGRAIVLDTLWILLIVVGFAGVLMVEDAPLALPVLAWSGAGGVAALWAFAQYGVPDRRGLAWVREHWGFSWRSLVSGVAGSGITLAFSALMTLFSSALAVAAFRAATLLAAPSTAVQLAVSTNAATDIARERERAGSYWPHVRKAFFISVAVGVVNLAVLLFLPDFIGHALLGDTWDIVEPLMLAVGMKVLLMAGQTGLRAALVGIHRIHVAMVTDIVALLLIAVTMVAGAAWGDAEGALWAMAVGTAVSTLCWWVAIGYASRNPERKRQRPGRHRADRAERAVRTVRR